MVDSGIIKVTINTANGEKEIQKRYFTANFVKINDAGENKPFSIRVAINKGRDKDAEFLNVAVDNNNKALDLIKEFVPGQQLFLDCNVVVSEKTDADGNPYMNYWLQRFDYGKTPQKAKGE